MEIEHIAKEIKEGRSSMWGLYGALEESFDYYLKGVARTAEYLKDADPEIILEALIKDYFDNCSSLNVYLTLSMLAGDIQGRLEHMEKQVEFTVGDQSLLPLVGVFAGVGYIDEITPQGFLFHRKNYFPGAVNDEVRNAQIEKDKLTITPSQDLLMPISPLKREVELSVHTFAAKQREIWIKHKATFINTNDPDKEDFILGPNVYFKENRQRLLYQSEAELSNWLRVLQIIRQPRIEVNKVKPRQVLPSGPGASGYYFG